MRGDHDEGRLLETVAGISLLRFDARGFVLEQRDAWASAPGRHELEAWAPAT